jgi:hypothetical protein
VEAIMGERSHTPRRHRAILRWLAAGVVAVAVTLGGAELLLRAFPQHLPTGMLFRLHDQAIDANDLNTRPHPDFGYLWQPRTRDRLEGWQFGFTFTTDQHGFRNSDPWPEQADIVVIGDSQAFGFGVDDEQVWVRQMAERLPDARIVNLGLIGAAPQQFPKVFAAFGAPLQPAVVLVAFFPPNAIQMGRLFSEWEADGRQDGFDERRFGATGPNGLVETIKDGLRESYALFGLYYALRTAAGASGVVTLEFDQGRQLHLATSRYGEEAQRAVDGHPDFAEVIGVLEQLHEMIEASGARMVAVPFPTKEEVHLPLVGETPHPMVTPFLAELERRGIPYIDLTPELRQRAAAGEKLFLEVDLHPNDAGHERIAEILIERLSGGAGGPAVLARTQ